MLNNRLPIKETRTGLNITMCGKGSCKCPAVDIDENKDEVLIGGKEEGYTTFTKEQFELLMNEVKGGRFAKYFTTTQGLPLPYTLRRSRIYLLV